MTQPPTLPAYGRNNPTPILSRIQALARALPPGMPDLPDYNRIQALEDFDAITQAVTNGQVSDEDGRHLCAINHCLAHGKPLLPGQYPVYRETLAILRHDTARAMTLQSSIDKAIGRIPA